MPPHRRLVIEAQPETTPFSLVSAGAPENVSEKALVGAIQGKQRMRPATCTIVGAACALAILFAPIAEAANAPLCLAIAANYNKCMRQHQRGWRGAYDDYGPGYGQAYPGGYGGYGGFDGYDGYDGYGWGYRRRRYERAKAACAIWFAQMQASGCFN